MLKGGVIAVCIFVLQGAFADQYIVRGANRLAGFRAMAPVLQSYPLTGAEIMDLTADTAEQLRLQGVQIEVNAEVRPFDTAQPQLPISPSDAWYLPAIHAPLANALPGGQGQGATVCLVDSGIDSTLLDLAGAITGGVNLNEGENPTDLTDHLYHGSEIALLIAGRGVAAVQGVAPAAKIYAVKVIAADGSSTSAKVAEGILSCIGKAQIINLSLGTFQDSPVMADAIDKAVAQGISVVAAAGNENTDIAFPARYAPVVGVGAVNADLKVSNYSGRGQGLDFVAPGENIPVLMANGAMGFVSGTSFSTAILSGVEAIRFSRGKTTRQARDLGFPAYEEGMGLIDAMLTAQ